jgi:hypothetical protein
MFGEPRGKRAGAAADVEDPPPAKITGVGEKPVDLRAKFGLRMTKLVVARRERAEVRGGATPRR